MLSRYQTIIWDWNGTILNDLVLCVNISNSILSQEGLNELSTNDYKNIFGFPITSYYERIGIDLSKTSMESLTKQFMSTYMSSVKKCQLHEDIKNIIISSKAAKKDQFILTASHTDIALELLTHFGIKDYFKDVAGLDNHNAASKIERGKELINANKVSIDETVLIGDTLHDFEVAEALGVDCVLVTHGHQSKEKLEDGTKGKAVVLERAVQLVEV